MKAKFLIAAFSALCLTPLVAAAGPQVRRAPDLLLQLVNGKELTLNTFKGKVVALEFILTTCSHCQESCVALHKMQREFGSQGFVPIAIAINEGANFALADFVRKFSLTYPVGWQRDETAMAFLQHPRMETMMMPQLVFIDRDGMIRSQFGGRDKFFDKMELSMRDQIKSLLALPGGAKKTAIAAKKK